jgi:DMSO/TMAO reductase YedYZ heme-binding membrane subunit
VIAPEIWWYLARATGLVAWGLAVASLLAGLALATRAMGPNPKGPWLLDLHRWLGGLSVVFLGLHLATIVADSYEHFGLADLFVPMASRWHPGDVAWGVVAVYLLVAVELTSLLRRRLPRKAWRAAHSLSFPLFVVATVHALLAGTDTARAWAQWSVIGASMAVAFLAVARSVAPNPDRQDFSGAPGG